MYDIAGIGAALFDTLMLTDEYPKEDTKLRSNSTKLQGGGPCSTALVAASKLGAGTTYMGTVGDDTYGKLIMDEFKKYKVGTDSIRILKNCVSANAFVLINTSAATRTCVWNYGTLPPLNEDDVDLDIIRNVHFIHLDGLHMDAAIYAAKKAHEFGVKVSLDAGGLYSGIENLLPHVDILIPSEEFALKFTGCKEAKEAMLTLKEKYNPEVLVITQGKSGGIIYHEGEIKEYPAFEVEVVDTNGAGDVFHGAFLVGLLKGMDTKACAYFASAVSALKCTKFGARVGVPTFDEAIEFLKSKGVNINDIA